MKNNLWKTIIALGFATLSASAFAQVRTIKPEDVPVMNPSALIGILVRPMTTTQGYLDLAYDTNFDGTEDIRFIYEYLYEETQSYVRLKTYAHDKNNNEYFEENEWIEVDYSCAPEQTPPQKPELPKPKEIPNAPNFNELVREYFNKGKKFDVV
jgi:hypothetical protein